MLHLRGASLGIPGVARIRHWIFPLLRQPEFTFGLLVFLRGCEFCHTDSPSQTCCTPSSLFGDGGEEWHHAGRSPCICQSRHPLTPPLWSDAALTRTADRNRCET